MSKEQYTKDRPDPGPDPYDNDEFSRSFDKIDELPEERSRRQVWQAWCMATLRSISKKGKYVKPKTSGPQADVWE